MALWPWTVDLGGASIPLAGILAELTIHHGRGSIADDPTATTCQLTLVDVERALTSAFEVGQPLVVTARDGAADPVPRFSGRVTDARLDGDELTVIATGEVSRLSSYGIGEASWPAEPWSARVSRCFAEAGLSDRLDLEPDPEFDPQLAARATETAGPTTLGDYLAFLASMLGALVCDRVDGRILVQALGSRTLDAAYTLDPALVAYSPAWTQELPGGNVITVRYQADQGESVTSTEPSSIELYGERPATIDTTFVESADALYRANQRLSRSAFPHWNIPEAPILAGLDLALGAGVVLSQMPEPSPFDPWTPIVEGWTDEIRGDAWTMLVSLSDPLLSGLVLPWISVPATSSYLWNTIDPATDWTEALTLEALDA